MTRKGGLKEVMRGINEGIKLLIKLFTMKYYYHCFINSPKVHIPQVTHEKGQEPKFLSLDFQDLRPKIHKWK